MRLSQSFEQNAVAVLHGSNASEALMTAPEIIEKMSVLEVTEMVQISDTVDDGETVKSLIENAGDHCALNAKKHGGTDDEGVGGDTED